MDDLIKFAADSLLIVILLIAGGLGVYHVVRTKIVAAVTPHALMASMTSLLIAKLMSLVYQPSSSRPFIDLGVSAKAAYIDNPGFPSDHVLLAGVIVIMLYVLTPYKKVALILAGLTVAMAIGRVLALVHTPVDVLGGAIAALVGSIWYLSLKRKQIQ